MSDILIGVSACLLGEQVRHDGGHKRNAFLLEELAPHVRFVPVCPEVGIGLGAPRESIRLVRRDDRIRLPGRRRRRTDPAKEEVARQTLSTPRPGGGGELGDSL